jgi:hypothetical protein
LIRKENRSQEGYILQKCSGATLLLLGVAAGVLSIASVLRYGMLESGFLPAGCGGSLAEGLDGWCAVKWLLVQSFVDQRLGWFGFVSGALAFIGRLRPLAWAGWGLGLAGLVLYNQELAAVGTLLSLLVLMRGSPQGWCGEGEPGR